MRTSLHLGLAVLVTAPLWAAPAPAQQATERYIPVGRSPGLSGEATLLGHIDAVDPAYRRLSVRGAQGSREVSVNDATQIWLDRTELGLTNTEGTLSDCRPQQQVEVKLADDGRTAVWIKVRMPDAPGP